MQLVCFDRKGKVLGLIHKHPWVNGKLDPKIVHEGTVTVKGNWDWSSYEEAVDAAAQLTERGTKWLAVDEGSHTSPRYGVFEAYKIGDLVSYCFNGDCHPCGTIIRITPTLTVVTSEGKRFRRVGSSSTWLMENGSWALTKGVHTDRNPSF
jgi:hypothetical protein